jgi:hypothetical protein
VPDPSAATLGSTVYPLTITVAPVHYAAFVINSDGYRIEAHYVMHGKSRGLSHRVDYDKPDWLRCRQTQFKVRFTPRLQVRHGYRYGCLLTSSFYGRYRRIFLILWLNPAKVS